MSDKQCHESNTLHKARTSQYHYVQRMCSHVTSVLQSDWWQPYVFCTQRMRR